MLTTVLDKKTMPMPESLLNGRVETPFSVDDDNLQIMLAEDVRADAVLTKLALEATNIPVSISRIRKGDEVLSKLSHGRMCYPSRLPDLIMLDLGLPGMDGFEILDELSGMPSSLRAIPIVILTGHENFDYVRDVYPLYIVDYMKKPCSAARMTEILTRVRSDRDISRALT